MDTDRAAIIERQARERATLAEELDKTRPERAQQRTKAEQDQPRPPHPTWAVPERPAIESIYQRHLHNLKIEDQKQLTMLDRQHEEELADFDKAEHKKRGADLQRGIAAYGERKAATELGHQLRAQPQRTDAEKLEEISAKMRGEPDKQRAAEQDKNQAAQHDKVPVRPPQTLAAELAHEQKTLPTTDAERLEEIRQRMRDAEKEITGRGR